MAKRAQYLGFKKSQRTEKRINVPLTFDGIQRTHTETQEKLQIVVRTGDDTF